MEEELGHVLRRFLVKIRRHLISDERLVVWPTSGPRVANRMEHELTCFGHAIDRCIAIRAKHLSECEHRLCSTTRRGKRHRPKLMLGIELIDSLVSGVIRGVTDMELGRVGSRLRLGENGFPHRGRLGVVGWSNRRGRSGAWLPVSRWASHQCTSFLVVRVKNTPKRLRWCDRGMTPGGSAGLPSERTFGEHFVANQIGCLAQSACEQRMKSPIPQYITAT
jgi:hypothetical protein